MRHFLLRAILVGLALAGCSAWGQTHKVAKPEQVVRAVGVYEWTGDLAKPTASRLIPVSIFIEGKFEDAGVYVARPVPFALLTGNVYELQAAGISRGFLDLAYARHIQTADGAFDDGWFGYGSFKAPTTARKAVALRPSKTLPVLTSSKGSSTDSNRPHLESKTSDSTTSATGNDSGKNTSKPDTSAGAGTSSASTNDSDRPTMKRRQGSEDTTASSGTPSNDAGAAKGTGSTSSDDPDSPTMKRRSSGESGDSTADSANSNSTSTKASSNTPADDPDRPTMKRRQGSEDTTDSSSTSTTTDSSSAKSTGSSPADDPDRPTMKRRSTDSSTDTTASTTGTGNTPADDPDRPTLKRHSAEDAKKAKSGENDVATTTGVGSLNDDPDRPNLHHGKPVGGAMTEADLPKLVGLPPDAHQMVAVSDAANRDPHDFSRDWEDSTEHATVLEKMQAMARAQLAAYGGAAAPAAPAVPVVKKTSTTRPRRTASPPAPTPEPLLDEQLKAYTLSYGGAATYVYMAHTAGTGAKLRYVTVVAQADGLGELKPAIQSVTDAAHLDRTPRMKFVDVVDAEASNRASLLFELRGQSARQFGLYRVIAARSEQIFLTGTTQ